MSVESGFSAKPKIVNFKAGANLSDEIDLKFTRIFGVTVGLSWSTANITMQVRRHEEDTWHDVYLDDGTEYTITASGDRHILIKWPACLFGLRYVRFRSGTSAAPVAQAAATSINLLTME